LHPLFPIFAECILGQTRACVIDAVEAEMVEALEETADGGGAERQLEPGGEDGKEAALTHRRVEIVATEVPGARLVAAKD
jgi:hypothetical protein